MDKGSSIPTLLSSSGLLAVMAAVKVAAKEPAVMVETTPAAIGGGIQRPAVLAIWWRQVASAAEKRAAEAASAMAEAVAVMVELEAAAVAEMAP